MIDCLRQRPDLWDLYSLKDDYGRVTGKECRESDGVIREPLVSRYLATKAGAEYPEGRRFAVCLTHDIDDVYPPPLHAALSSAQCVKSLDGNGMKRWALWRVKGKEHSPYRNFREIMDLEDRFGGRSSFYFLATDRDPRRFRYRVEELGQEMGAICDRGWEVGLHGSYYACDDPGEIRKEKRRLEKALGREVIGYRNHYLMFRVPDTWEHLAAAGFRYDTTVGYSNAIGFRNGVCHPYRPFNLRSGREIDIVEIPLAIMDTALFRRSRSLEEACRLSSRIVDAVERYHGVLTLLWHNNSLVSPAYRAGWAKVYAKLLEYCHGKGAWMTSGEEIYRWAVKNKSLQGGTD
jgi:peptidoglycan/xylan/chitin deacetylase (PgdA/CDA1 family)